MIIIYITLLTKNQPYVFINSYGCYLVLTIFPIAFFSMMANNFEFKKSFILRKLKIEQFTKWKYLVILLSYYLMVMVIATSIISIIFLLFNLNPIEFELTTFYDTKNKVTLWMLLQTYNIRSLIFSLLLTIYLSLMLGIFISTFTKNSISAQFIGFGLIIITLILSGQIFPLNQWVIVRFMKYLTFINPIEYSINLLNISSIFATVPQMNNIFDFNIDVYLFDLRTTNSIIYFAFSKPIFIFVPIIMSTIMLIISIRKLNWKHR